MSLSLSYKDVRPLSVMRGLTLLLSLFLLATASAGEHIRQITELTEK